MGVGRHYRIMQVECVLASRCSAVGTKVSCDQGTQGTTGAND